MSVIRDSWGLNTARPAARAVGAPLHEAAAAAEAAVAAAGTMNTARPAAAPSHEKQHTIA